MVACSKRNFNEVEKQPAHWFVLGGRVVLGLTDRPYWYLRPSEKWPSTKVNLKMANRQSSNRVRAYRTHPTRWV